MPVPGPGAEEPLPAGGTVRADPVERIGFIGIGNMGSRMAAHLVRAGFDVAVFDLRDEACERFVAAHGGRAARSPAAAGEQADAIITMLPDGKAVQHAVLGPDGAAARLAPGAIVLDMSTSDPADTKALAAALAGTGIAVVDAPVMGGVAFATDATLDIMAGGDAGALARLDPVFRALGRKVYACGPLGSGHALKALNNYVNACAMIGMMEALVAGRRLGIDAAAMVESLGAMCTGRNHPLDKKIVPHVLTGRFASGMSMGFIAKDVRIAVETALAAGAPVPLAECCARIWESAAAELGAGLDQTEIVRWWERRAGVSVRDR